MALGLRKSPGPGGGARPGRGRRPAHRVVVRVQVGHEHGGKGAQEPVYFVSVVAAQLPEGALPAIQQQGRVGATGGDRFALRQEGRTRLGARLPGRLSSSRGSCCQGDGGLTCPSL